jgi:signal transduction histidine kinase
VVAVSRWLAPWTRNRLFRKYVVPFAAVVCGALLANGLLDIYFTYREARAQLGQLQREKASAAALRIEQFVREIERQIAWTTQPQLTPMPAALEQRQMDYVRLQRQVPAITEVAFIDGNGREQLRLSRVMMDVVASGADASNDPIFRETRGGRVWYGPVYFRKESEPYMTVAVPHGSSPKAAVTAAEVNLKFIWDVVSQIHVGRLGQAYVVDREGQLIAHPDISLVLRKTDLSTQPHVAAARRGDGDAMLSTDLGGRSTLVAHTVIAPLGWTVFVEQPLTEAFQPLRGAIFRTALLMLFGVFVSVVASLALARKIGGPVEALQAGAERIGGGELAHRIDVRTRDELQDLGDQFNRMADQLQQSYATLEQKVEDRTRELSESLDQQTATADILRVISGSPTDVQPVLDAVAERAARLCGATDALIYRTDGGTMRRVAHFGGIASVAEQHAVTRDTPSGRAVLERRTIHQHDILEAFARGEYLEARPLQQATGFRTILVVPLVREGDVIGLINIRRLDVQPFTEKQIALVQTFADQAVIAIENVRLFKELEARTFELTRSVEELQALGELGRTLASTLDLPTVLKTILTQANELAGTDGGAIYEFEAEGGRFHLLHASESFDAAFLEVLRATPLVYGEGAVGRAAEAREPVQIPDILDSTFYTSRIRDAVLGAGYLALLAVPLVSEDEVVGALVINRRAPGEFPPRVVDVLRTFATQSALAIQNARLFREIEEKSRQLEAANRHKDEFLASMSHELRTPLNAVIGFSEVLLERMFGDVNDKQEEYLQDILASGRHLLSLINDILDLAKIEAGRMELDLEEFDVAQAVDNAVVLVRERATRKGLTLDTELDRRLGSVRGDQRKVKQVLLNLLSNAIKFTPEGGRIEVRAQRLDGQVEMSVTDTGIGIAAEDLDTVFEEFRQVGTDYAKKHEGTGLGLTLSRKFVELHGGRIWVKSQPGEGSTFTFTLPGGPWPVS